VKEGILQSQALVQDQGGLPLTAPDLNAFLQEAFTYGSNSKMLMSGGNLLTATSEIARGQLRIKQGDETYGLSISTWETPHGVVKLVKNPTFIGSLAGMGLVLDLDCFWYRYLPGRDTSLQMNVQAPDMDGEVDQYVTEAGLERVLMSKCALIENIG